MSVKSIPTPLKGGRVPGREGMDEIELIEERYRNGELHSITAHLVEFVTRHREEIIAMAKPDGSEPRLLDAVKNMVQQRGSIHLPSEMADQIKEINNEIWYRGEKGDLDRSKIKEEWAMKYAAMWRQFRIKEILFVVDRKKDEILAALKA